MTSRTTSRALLALVLATSLAACGGDDGGDPTLTQPSAPPTSFASPAAPIQEPCEERPPTTPPPAGAIEDLGTKPAVQPNDAPPPCGLVVSDIVVGTGAEAVAGSTVAVKYVGAFYETGEQFDSSWSRGPDETLPVTLGAGQVIPGFEQAITGMNVGGRRLVTIPSDLAYGPQGRGQIPGGATLTFVLDLVEVGA